MFESNHPSMIHVLRGITTACLLAAVAITGPVRASENAAEQPPDLAQLGLELDRARLLPPAERSNALVDLALQVDELSRADVTADERTIIQYLSGEIRYELGEHQGAAEAFDKAADARDRWPFSADAGRRPGEMRKPRAPGASGRRSTRPARTFRMPGWPGPGTPFGGCSSRRPRSSSRNWPRSIPG
jgi:hypothetical protein